MPGIAAIFGDGPSAECEDWLRTMVAALRRSSFEVSGICNEPRLGVHAGWVAQAGSFAARVSPALHAGELRLLASGEWFDDEDFDDGLATRDALSNEAPRACVEMLDRYERDGARAVSTLNGLFAGLLIDRRRRRALLFNDRYGSERLYVHECDGRVFVASEAKALLAVLPKLRALDDRGVAQFLAYGNTLEGRTLFRGISLVPAASIWTFEPQRRTTRERYFLPGEWESLPTLSNEAFTDALTDTLDRRLPHYTRSGRSLGISLTGGLDTRMIMACLSSLTHLPTCYTFAGTRGETLDVRIAARVAAACGLPHHIIRIGSDFIANYAHYVDRTVYVTDGCAGPLDAHELYLCEAARQLAPIRLTGNYGSEVLRGMSTFREVALAPDLLGSGIRESLEAEVTEARARARHPVTRAAFEEIPWHLFGTLAAARSQLTFRTPYLDNDLVRLAFQAPADARHSAEPSLKLVQRKRRSLAAIPTDRGRTRDAGMRSLLRRIACEVTFKVDYLYTEGLPDALAPLRAPLAALAFTPIVGLHKFLPYRTWMGREFSRYVKEVVTDAQTLRLPHFNARTVATLADQQRNGKNRLRDIHAVLALEAVERLLINGSARDAYQRPVMNVRVHDGDWVDASQQAPAMMPPGA
jgi:asparagine synthase (glutamine-hydrolysing)